MRQAFQQRKQHAQSHRGMEEQDMFEVLPELGWGRAYMSDISRINSEKIKIFASHILKTKQSL